MQHSPKHYLTVKVFTDLFRHIMALKPILSLTVSIIMMPKEML